MKRTYNILTFAALAACSLQIHGIEGRLEYKAPTTDAPNAPRYTPEQQRSIDALNAEHANEIENISNNFNDPMRKKIMIEKQQEISAKQISGINTADLVAQLKSQFKGNVSLKQQADLAKAIEKVKNAYTGTDAQPALKSRAFEELNEALTKIAQQNGDTNFTHEKFFEGLDKAEKTGNPWTYLNSLKLSLAKAIAPLQKEKAIKVTIDQIDVAKGKVNELKNEILQSKTAKHTQKMTDFVSGFQAFPGKATRAESTLEETFQSKIKDANPSDKKKYIDTLLGKQADLATLNKALKLSYLRLTEERNQKQLQLLQDIVRKIDPEIKITPDNYDEQIKPELEKIFKLIGETSNQSLAQNLRGLGFLPQ